MPCCALTILLLLRAECSHGLLAGDLAFPPTRSGCDAALRFRPVLRRFRFRGGLAVLGTGLAPTGS